MNSIPIRLEHVTKRYGDRTVVGDITLNVAAGDIVALLGESGSGKTTTLRMIAGLETPDDGEIWIGGNRVAAGGRNLVPPHERKIGFVFQDLALWPHMTVRGNLEFMLASARIPKDKWAQRIEETLRLVRIGQFATAYPEKLSGGEQQRAALARAMVGQPDLLLLDEAMSSLDISLKSQLLSELADLQNRLKVTTVYITHDPEEAVVLAHRVAVMQGGQIIEEGTVKELRPQLLKRSLIRAL